MVASGLEPLTQAIGILGHVQFVSTETQTGHNISI